MPSSPTSVVWRNSPEWEERKRQRKMRLAVFERPRRSADFTGSLVAVARLLRGSARSLSGALEEGGAGAEGVALEEFQRSIQTRSGLRNGRCPADISKRVMPSDQMSLRGLASAPRKFRARCMGAFRRSLWHRWTIGSTSSFGELAFARKRGNTKVQNLELTGRSDNDIGRLNIPMNYAMFVRMRERGSDLPSIPHDQLWRSPSGGMSVLSGAPSMSSITMRY